MHRLLHVVEVVDHHRRDVRQLRHQAVHGAHRSDRAGQLVERLNIKTPFTRRDLSKTTTWC